jgi:type VI protein secretion system component VasK
MTTQEQPLSSEQLLALDDTQKANVAAMEQFFASTGWKFLQTWIQSNIDLATGRVMYAPNWEAYIIARTTLAEFKRWQELEQSFFAEYASLADAALESRFPDKEDLEDTLGVIE